MRIKIGKATAALGNIHQLTHSFNNIFIFLRWEDHFKVKCQQIQFQMSGHNAHLFFGNVLNKHLGLSFGTHKTFNEENESGMEGAQNKYKQSTSGYN